MRGSADTTVSVSWAGATDNVGVAGYRLFLDDREIATTTDTEFLFTELACGRGYRVGVSYDAAGNHSERATAVVTTAPCADTEHPTTPADLTLTSTATSISVRWSGSVDNVGVVGHGLYRNGTLVATTAETGYTFTGLACDTSYTLAVDSFDAAGNRSGRISSVMTTISCVDPSHPRRQQGWEEAEPTRRRSR